MSAELSEEEHARMFAVVKASLARKLAVSAPRFDTSADIERAPSR